MRIKGAKARRLESKHTPKLLANCNKIVMNTYVASGGQPLNPLPLAHLKTS